MNELKEKIVWARNNQKDLYELVDVSTKIIQQNDISKVFTNFANETYLASFIQEPKIKSVVFNSLDRKHYKEWEGFKKCKFLNKLHFKVVVGEYDLMQFDCSHFIEDWKHFAGYMISNSTKFIYLNNTESVSKEERNEIVKSFYLQDFFIHQSFDGYYGKIILANGRN